MRSMHPQLSFSQKKGNMQKETRQRVSALVMLQSGSGLTREDLA